MRSAEGRLGRFSAVGLMGVGLQLLLMCPLTNFGFLSVTATPIAVETNHHWRDRVVLGGEFPGRGSFVVRVQEPKDKR